MDHRLTLDKNSIQAKVYHINPSGVHYLKIEMFGMYISDITVRESIKFSGPWVQMPRYQKGNGYKRIVEFFPGSPLKQWIEEACIEAVEICADTKQLTDMTDSIVDDLMSEKELKKEFDALPY